LRQGTTPIKNATDSFLVPDNGIFTAQNAVKPYDRKKNRYGNDEAESIQKYDESVVDESLYDERKKNAHKHKKNKRHVFINGEWKGVASQARNNREGKEDARTIYGKKGKVEIVKEDKDTSALKSWFKKKKEEKNEKNDNNEGGASVGGIGESSINELSTALLVRYAKKSVSQGGQSAYEAGDLGPKKGAPQPRKAQKRIKGVKHAINHIASRSIVETLTKNGQKYADTHPQKELEGDYEEELAKKKQEKRKTEEKKKGVMECKIVEDKETDDLIAAFKAKGGKIKKIETGASNNISSYAWKKAAQDDGEPIVGKEESERRSTERKAERKAQSSFERIYHRRLGEAEIFESKVALVKSIILGEEGLTEAWKYKDFGSEEAARVARLTHFANPETKSNACRLLKGGKLAYMGKLGCLPDKPKPKEVEMVKEVLTQKTPVSTYIKDFVDSTDPKFEGKTKKERIKMALGAYYSKHKE
jgi:hypothetical protein